MSERIQKLASYVRPNSLVYDLCCDHGLIGLSAWDSKPLRGIVFVDQAPRALEALRKDLTGRGLHSDPRIQVKVCSAETLKIPREACDFIIAGVGCRTIVTILQKLFKKGLFPHRLILCPEKNSSSLRQFLHERKFGLVAEGVVLQMGRFREIIVIEAEGGPIHLMGEGFSQAEDEASRNFAASLQRWQDAIQAKKNTGHKPQGKFIPQVDHLSR